MTPADGAQSKPNNRKRVRNKTSKKKKKKASNIEFCSINKYKLKLNCEARKMTMLTVTKLVLALETKEEECWNLLINEK